MYVYYSFCYLVHYVMSVMTGLFNDNEHMYMPQDTE